MTHENSSSNPSVPPDEKTPAEGPAKAVTDRGEALAPDGSDPSRSSPATSKPAAIPPRPAVPTPAAKSPSIAKSAAQKPADKPTASAPPFEPKPSLPVSMIMRPHSAADKNGSVFFP